MSQTIDAVINEKGEVFLLEALQLKKPHRALVTILEEKTTLEEKETDVLLSEAALSKDWNRPEEDEAWSHL
ncbi:hypothetical protein ACQZV8_00120 [Magnetococcales bacterium HHB-1]